jgi:DtxR family Mn-dependent transcriptional regulator
MLARMDDALGHPWRDPHGDAIPTPDGLLHRPEARPLASLEPGEVGWIARILDEEPELLRWFGEHGLTLDTRLTVIGHKPFGGAFTVAIGPDGDETGCHYAQCHHEGVPA